MTDLRLDVYLLAAPQPGIDRSDLVRNLASTFKKDIPSIEKMLRRPRTLIKENIEETLANKYKSLIESAGGQCDLVPHGQTLELKTAETAQPLALTPMTNQPASAPTEGICYCTKCGSLITAGQTKCPQCFTPITTYTGKNKTVAGLLAFFVGGLGIHRLYLGQWWGVLYLIFWGTLIPSIVSLIEAVIFWSTAQKTWDEKYGQVEKTSGVMAAIFVCAFFVCITLTGILAAVALPAYQDYTVRAKINNSINEVDKVQQKVAAFILKNHSYPNDNILVNLPEAISTKDIESIKLRDGGNIEVTFKIPTLKDNNTIIWSPTEQNGKVTWDCTQGTMQNRNRPPVCRGTTDPISQSSSADNPLSKEIYSDDKTLSIKVPENWKMDKSLTDTALIGASHGTQQYVLVFSEAKADIDNMTLAEYTAIIQEQLGTHVEKMQMQDQPAPVTMASFNAEQFSFVGSTQRVNLGYVVTIVETDKSFVRILAWCAQSQLPKNKALFSGIGESLKVNE